MNEDLLLKEVLQFMVNNQETLQEAFKQGLGYSMDTTINPKNLLGLNTQDLSMFINRMLMIKMQLHQYTPEELRYLFTVLKEECPRIVAGASVEISESLKSSVNIIQAFAHKTVDVKSLEDQPDAIKNTIESLVAGIHKAFLQGYPHNAAVKSFNTVKLAECMRSAEHIAISAKQSLLAVKTNAMYNRDVYGVIQNKVFIDLHECASFVANGEAQIAAFGYDIAIPELIAAETMLQTLHFESSGLYRTLDPFIINFMDTIIEYAKYDIYWQIEYAKYDRLQEGAYFFGNRMGALYFPESSIEQDIYKLAYKGAAIGTGTVVCVYVGGKVGGFW